MLVSLVFADGKDLGSTRTINTSTPKTAREGGGAFGWLGASIFENRVLAMAGRITRVSQVLDLDRDTDDPKADAKEQLLSAEGLLRRSVVHAQGAIFNRS